MTVPFISDIYIYPRKWFRYGEGSRFLFCSLNSQIHYGGVTKEKFPDVAGKGNCRQKETDDLIAR